MKRHISTPDAPAPIGAYSQAVEASGTMLFLSGQIALTPEGKLVIGGIEEQTEQVLENIQAVLDEAGYSVNNIVKTTVFLKDMNYFPKMNEIYEEFFGQSAPARSAVEVSRLPKDVMIEIEVIAMKEQ